MAGNKKDGKGFNDDEDDESIIFFMCPEGGTTSYWRTFRRFLCV